MNFLRRLRGNADGSERPSDTSSIIDLEGGGETRSLKDDNDNQQPKQEEENRPASATPQKKRRYRSSSRPSSATGHYRGRALEKRHTDPNPTSPMSEEESTARLSRRSSVLVDLIALFRRSSSVGLPGLGGGGGGHKHLPGHAQQAADHDGDTTDDVENYDENPDFSSKERILQVIRENKEIIGRVRLQPWPMQRKRRTLRAAMKQKQKHEARVSRWNLYKVEVQRRAKQFWRWSVNLWIYLIPWESKIKRIESHFGSVVSSYFIFLRWVLGANVTISAIMMLFVVIPEWLADSKMDAARFNRTKHIKIIPPKILAHADELNTVLDFGGYLQYSYLFYGYYSPETVIKSIFLPYDVPVAYFCVNLFLLAFCVFIILKKMTSNTRKSKLSGGKQEQYVFTWKAVTGWDYNLGDAETAGSLYKANVMKLRETIAEYNKRIRQKLTLLRFVVRLFCNIIIVSMILLSVYAIYRVAQITDKNTFLEQNAVSITVALSTLLFPPIFELILKLERYRPKTALRIHLFRVLVFYLINYFTLVYSLFIMLNTLEAEMRANEIYDQWDRGDQVHLKAHSPYPAYDKTFYEYVPRYRTSAFRSSRDLKNGSGESSSPLSSILYANVPLFPTTTAEPPKAKTTILPNYGPFGVGVYNPKAIVSSGKAHSGKAHDRVPETIYESRAVGPVDVWSDTATDSPVPLNYTTMPRTRVQFYRATKYDDLCWETLIGQEIAKIVTTDLVMTICAILVIDFLRGLWIRYCSVWWCWDIESTFPEYGEFKVAENVLHLVNNQGMICLGTILVPMLPMINNIKLVILMYIRAWACMTCNVPAKQIFRASRSSNFYFWLLLMMLCMSTLPVGFVIWSKQPSKNCGPFSGQERFYSVISELLHNNLNKNVVEVITYIMSPGIVIPVLLLLILMIYFLVLLVNGLRAANTDLAKQLTHERTEEKKKIFELAHGGRRKASGICGYPHRPTDLKLLKVGGDPLHVSSSSNGGGEGGDKNNFDDHQQQQMKNINASPNLKEALTGIRSSWHGDSAAFPAVNTFGILKMPSNARRSLIQQNSDERSESISPSKSPIRHTLFLPSLQSVNEDDADGSEEEQMATSSHSRRKSNQSRTSKTSSHEAAAAAERRRSSQQAAAAAEHRKTSSSGSIQRASQHQQMVVAASPSSSSSTITTSAASILLSTSTPFKLTWAQRFRICIGAADPRDYIPRKKITTTKSDRQKLAADISRKEAADEERRRYSAAAAATEKKLPPQQEHHKIPAPAEHVLLSSGGERMLAKPMPLDETDFSESSTDTPRRKREEAKKKKQVVEMQRSCHPSISSRSSFGEKPNIEELKSSLTSDDTGRVTMIMNKFPEFPIYEISPHASRTTSVESSTHKPAESKKSPPVPTYAIPPTAALPIMMRSSSASDRQRMKANVERDLASESSPLLARRPIELISDEGALSPEKRSPQSNYKRRKTTKDESLPSTKKEIGAPIDDLIHRLKSTNGQNGRQMADSLERASNSNGSDETRPPSDESLRDPTPALSTALPQRKSSDPRLYYANPYGSYAAAMCSPLYPFDSSSSNGGVQNNANQQPKKPLPRGTTTSSSLSQSIYAAAPIPTTDDQLLHQRRASTDSSSKQRNGSERRKQFAEAATRAPPPPPSIQKSSWFPGTAALPPLIPVEPTYTVRAKRPSTRESAAGDDRLESWKKRLQQQQKNKKPPADQQQQIYDSPAEPLLHAPPHIHHEPRGSLTSGRGTITSVDPADYGHTSSPSTSSPEFGHQRFRISSSSPKQLHRHLQHLSDLGSGSSEQSPSWNRRRFEIRQRSALCDPPGRGVADQQQQKIPMQTAGHSILNKLRSEATYELDENGEKHTLV